MNRRQFLPKFVGLVAAIVGGKAIAKELFEKEEVTITGGNQNPKDGLFEVQEIPKEWTMISQIDKKRSMYRVNVSKRYGWWSGEKWLNAGWEVVARLRANGLILCYVYFKPYIEGSSSPYNV